MLRTISRARRSSRLVSLLPAQRCYAVPTSSRLRPAEALATRDDDYTPEISYDSNDASRSMDRSYPHMLDSARHPTYRPLTPFKEDEITVLPPPLPDDQPASDAQAALYPSTSLLDSLSLIHICLGRKDTIPRAFDIFWTLLDDHAAGRTSLPDAHVWASVIEGVLSLDAPKQAGGRSPNRKAAWASKAEALVAEWEKFNGGRSEPGTSRPRPLGLGRGGEKVYAGWLRGLVESGLSVSPVLPYLHSHSLSLATMMAVWSPEEKTKGLTALRKAAEVEEDTVALKAVNQTLGMEQDRRERLERGMPVEVNPLPAVSTWCMGQSGRPETEPDPHLAERAVYHDIIATDRFTISRPGRRSASVRHCQSACHLQGGDTGRSSSSATRDARSCIAPGSKSRNRERSAASARTGSQGCCRLSALAIGETSGLDVAMEHRADGPLDNRARSSGVENQGDGCYQEPQGSRTELGSFALPSLAIAGEDGARDHP